MRKGLLLLALGIALAAPLGRADASGSVSISFFHDELSPHGDWISVGSYGHCWRPRGIDRDWQPYSNGEWLYTEYGWTWVSNDPWGGDPYHYGTWSRSASYGWFWIPGTIWAPAWVTWSIGDSYIGWAPVSPSFYVGSSGYSGSAVTVALTSYVFVQTTQFAGVNVGTVRVPMAENATYLSRTRPMTRFTATNGVLTSGGPAVADVERATQRKIARVDVGSAHTKAVPFHAALGGRRGSVIAPAAERAKLTASRTAASPKVARVTHEKPAQHAKQRVTHEKTAQHAKQRVDHEKPAQHVKVRAAQERPAKHAKPVRHVEARVVRERVEPASSRQEHGRKAEPAVSIERHAAPAPRAEAAHQPQGHDAARQAPPQQAAPARHPDKHQPDAPAQGGNDRAPKKEHGREKSN